MSDTEKKKSALISAIRSREDALKIVRQVSYICYFYVALDIVVGIFQKYPMVLDGIGIALLVLGFFLHRFKSRIAATLLLLLTVGMLVLKVVVMFGPFYWGGSNFLIVVVILAVVLMRAVEATFKLHGKFRELAVSNGVLPNPPKP
jgi:hypothetical protein